MGAERLRDIIIIGLVVQALLGYAAAVKVLIVLGRRLRPSTSTGKLGPGAIGAGLVSVAIFGGLAVSTLGSDALTVVAFLWIPLLGAVIHGHAAYVPWRLSGGGSDEGMPPGFGFVATAVVLACSLGVYLLSSLANSLLDQ